MMLSRDTLLHQLPRSLNFYGQGQIHRASGNTLELKEDIFGALIQVKLLDSPKQLLIMTIMDKGLDYSVYSEFSNVLASRLASLSPGSFPTPPRPISEKQIHQLITHYTPTLCSKYIHQQDGCFISIQTAIFIVDQLEVGHA